MRSSFYQILLLRIGSASRKVFASSEGDTGVKMRGIRGMSMNSGAKKGNKHVLDARKKTKHALTASSRNALSKISRPNVITREEEEEKERLVTELKILPGVGRKNAALLSAKGLTDVESLRNVFIEKFDANDTPFIEFLHQDVGIFHKCHCQSIVGYLTENENSEKIKEGKERFTFSIEGNISAGKTTFLNCLSDAAFEIQDLCELVEEPIAEWQKVDGFEDNNLLERFYNDPKKHAYEFQNYAFLTRLRQNRKTFAGDKPLRIMERSIFSDRLVFVRAIHEANWMSDHQLQLYDSWFNPLLTDTPGLVPDGFIYLRANPKTCMRRMQRRSRNEELAISPEYLEGLHEKHEEWFNMKEWRKRSSLLLPAKTPVVPKLHGRIGQNVLEPPLPPELEGCIVWLGNGGGILSADDILTNENTSSASDKVPKAIKAAVSNVPALILDYDMDFDIEKDQEAKKHYSKKVKAYFDYVRNSRRQKKNFWSSIHAESFRTRWQIVNALSDERMEQLKCELNGNHDGGTHEGFNISENMIIV